MSNIASPKTSARLQTEATKPSNGSSRAEFLDQELFVRMLRLERKRTERSQRPFVLMLLDSRLLLKAANSREQFEKVLCAMTSSTRETDIKGWYEDGAIFGVIFTEIGTADGKSVTNGLLTRVTNALCTSLSIE